MSIQAGQLTIDVAAGVARIKSDMAEVKGVVKGTMSDIDSAVGFAKKALGALGVVIGGEMLLSLARQSMAAIDATAKLADRLGITTEAMTGIMHAADLAGVAHETVTKAMRTMATQAYEAAQGLGQSAAAFNHLHINAKEFINLAPDKQLETLLTRLSAVQNVTERNALAAQVFGARASEMLNLINEGGAGIRKATEDAEAWGAALNRVDSAKVELANDAMTRAKEAAMGVANTIVVQLSPYIKAMADGFADSAKEAHGWKNEIINGVEAVAMGLSYVADGAHFLHLGFKVMEDGISGVVNDIIQLVAWLDRSFTETYNKIAGSYIGKKLGLEMVSFNEQLQVAAAASEKAIDKLDAEVVALASKPLPHTGVQQFFADIKKRAQSAAEEVAKARSGQAKGGAANLGEDKAAIQQKKEYDAYIKGIANRLAAVQKGFMSERQIETRAYQQKQYDLLEALQAGLLTQQEYDAAEQNLETEHQAAMGNIAAQGAIARRDFEQKTAVEKTQFVLGQLAEMTQGVATHNKAMFEINKIAGIANAIINTAMGVTKALSSYPPPLSFAMAAAQLAAGLAQVAQIRSASFGSSSSAPSIGGGAAVPTTPAVNAALPTAAPAPTGASQGVPAAAPRVVHINVGSDTGMLSAEYVREKLIPAINDAVGDGVSILVGA